MKQEAAAFELSFPPNVESISVVRTFVQGFYAHFLHDPERVSQLAMVTHELLENAVCYGHARAASVRVAFAREDEGARVSVTTRNSSDPAAYERVAAALEEMAAAPTPMHHYLELMRRTAKRTDGSGLGLGRIHAEGDMDLTCGYREGELSIVASAYFSAPQGLE